MQTFYSQEQYDEYQRDLEGDGYSNEYQRCYEQSRIRRPIKNEEARAAELTAQGKFVVCSLIEVCCPITDGLLGYDFAIIQEFSSRPLAEAFLRDSYECFIFELEVETPEPPLEEPDYFDDIPF